MTGLLLNGILFFGILTLIFAPLEVLFRKQPQGLWRRESFTDLLFFFGQALLWTAPVTAALAWFITASDRLPLAGIRDAVAGWPLWLQIVAGLAVSDLCIYWGHRLSHRNAFLWRFHRVHHTSQALDYVAAYREHPFDNLYTRTIENAPLIVLGIPLQVVAGFIVFRGLWAVYIHSNVALEPGPLRVLLGSPRLHHWHHEKRSHARVNFANLSPLMDVLFGTYHDPGHHPQEYGIAARVSHGYVAQMVGPLLPRGLERRLFPVARRGRLDPRVRPRGAVKGVRVPAGGLSARGGGR